MVIFTTSNWNYPAPWHHDIALLFGQSASSETKAVKLSPYGGGDSDVDLGRIEVLKSSMINHLAIGVPPWLRKPPQRRKVFIELGPRGSKTPTQPLTLYALRAALAAEVHLGEDPGFGNLGGVDWSD